MTMMTIVAIVARPQRFAVSSGIRLKRRSMRRVLKSARSTERPMTTMLPQMSTSLRSLRWSQYMSTGQCQR